ncbi:hypothetical protein I6F35_38585 [Bradyrhizobium sp. BRP22]|uniref:hypothetical protein n=1 Tax=Bradyrhizobium sp. BRP22 TaxID=2793821 RepID=UPI001CD1E785|nr:hypothetical protein [Bradyrhizobium sp. BRP22]MCA1458958.1 hypothetical protein [Bradyrhizobium sp. BRP22]
MEAAVEMAVEPETERKGQPPCSTARRAADQVELAVPLVLEEEAVTPAKVVTELTWSL